MKNLKRITAVALSLVLLFCGCSGKDSASVDTASGNAAQIEFLENAAVSYLGPEGTYTEEAAKLFFGESGSFLPEETVSDAVRQLLDGNCDYAVIPQENTIGGAVYDYIDEFLSHEELSVVGEVELPIRQALLAKEGTQLGDIRTVYSHKQGITQGADWLKSNLPEAEVIPVASTAEGARMVSENGSSDCAAIASTGAARVYGLSVLAENIQMNEDNKTRFYVLSREAPNGSAGERMAFTARGGAEHLPELLGKIEHQGLKLVFIHDRPEKTTLGSYIWLIECEGGDKDAYSAITSDVQLECRYCGAFSLKQG